MVEWKNVWEFLVKFVIVGLDELEVEKECFVIIFEKNYLGTVYVAVRGRYYGNKAYRNRVKFFAAEMDFRENPNKGVNWI